MPWKKNDTGAFDVDQNGNPIFVLEGGEERSVDYSAMSASLAKANREAAERKEKIRSLEAQAKAFEGIEDVPAFILKAKKDAEAVAAFDDKQKTTEESARARVEAATAPLKAQLKELEAARDNAVSKYHRALIDSNFGTSKYVSDELVNAALVKELFSRFFSVSDEGKIVAVGHDGNVIYDDTGPAGFESALRKLVTDSPYKDIVLRGNNATGSGANPGSNGARTAGQAVMRRSEFDSKTPQQKADLMLKGLKIVDG